MALVTMQDVLKVAEEKKILRIQENGMGKPTEL